MLTKLVFIILQTISMPQYAQDRHLDNPIIHPACSSTLHEQQAYVEHPSFISTLQPISEEADSKASIPPFLVDDAYERYLTKESLKKEGDNLFHSIIVLEFFVEEIRSVDTFDLHIYTRRTGIYDKYVNENPTMGIMLRELHALDEEYKNTHNELRKRNIIARLGQIRIALYYHLMRHLNYKRILYAITLSRIYIYEFRQKVEVALYIKKYNL